MALESLLNANSRLNLSLHIHFTSSVNCQRQDWLDASQHEVMTNAMKCFAREIISKYWKPAQIIFNKDSGALSKEPAWCNVKLRVLVCCFCVLILIYAPPPIKITAFLWRWESVDEPLDEATCEARQPSLELRSPQTPLPGPPQYCCIDQHAPQGAVIAMFQHSTATEGKADPCRFLVRVLLYCSTYTSTNSSRNQIAQPMREAECTVSAEVREFISGSVRATSFVISYI